ncbi:STAS domain-containing protein [Actinosynnema sp. NPDC050436]|uniref:STAS domain-containing protein n=1 Tax=Actinosynnema sp. NPDC050436 TaxID=3155659 RepID=UPI0033CCCA5C
MPVGVVEERGGKAVVLHLTGVFDAAHADSTAAHLHRAIAGMPPPPLVVVVLSGLDLLAAAGIHVLGRFARSCAQRGVRVAAVLDGALRSVVEFAVRRSMLVFATVDEALAGCG